MREVQDVAHRGGPEGVDRLGIVADHGQPAPVGLDPLQDGGLDGVGVLVLVDQDEVEPAPQIGRDLGHGHHLLPPQQEIVIVQDALALLGVDIGAEQRLSSAVHSAHQGKQSCSTRSSGAWALTA